MSLFGNLKTEGLEKTEDRLGGFSQPNTDSYDAQIKVMYAVNAANSGAKGIAVVADIGGQEYRETIWITNKQGENWFPNKQDPTKRIPLPGFTTINDLCLIGSGKELAEQTTEEKMVKIYDYDAKREVPKSVHVLTDLTDAKVTLGLVKTLVNKTQKQGDEYVPVADTREEVSIDKVFDTGTKLTVVEAQTAAANNTTATAVFHPAWVEKNRGVTRDKRTIKDGQAGSSAKPGGAPQASSGGAPRQSLFGAKN